MYAIKILGLSIDYPTHHAGKWLMKFNPEYDDGRGMVWSTNDIEKAMKFETATEAMALYRTQSKIHPIRLTDGKPNRPLTAFNVTIEKLS